MNSPTSKAYESRNALKNNINSIELDIKNTKDIEDSSRLINHNNDKLDGKIYIK